MFALILIILASIVLGVVACAISSSAVRISHRREVAFMASRRLARASMVPGLLDDEGPRHL